MASAATVEEIVEEFDLGSDLKIDTAEFGNNETPRQMTGSTGFTWGGMAIADWSGANIEAKSNRLQFKQLDASSYAYTIFDSRGGNSANTAINLIEGRIKAEISLKEDYAGGISFRYMVRNGGGNWYLSDSYFTAVSAEKIWYELETTYGDDTWTEITNTASLDALAGNDEVALTLGSSGLNPQLDSVDGIGIYFSSDLKSGGKKLHCWEMKIETINSRGCFPSNHPDYAEWVFAGKPRSWCYPRHCHGDADGLRRGSYWVGLTDFAILANAWHVQNPTLGQVAADFNYSNQVDYGDMKIFAENWLSDPEPDCIPSQWQSELVHYDSNGLLAYEPEPYSGHRIPDFSHAGYDGGGVPLPIVPTVMTISPVAGDNAAHIQAAIDEVSAMPVDANGFHGALLLSAGTYEIHSPITVSTSGVVLRGAGDDEYPATNTIIYRKHTYPDGLDDQEKAVVRFKGEGDSKFNSKVSGTDSTDIVTSYVPVGGKSFEVADASDFNVGNNIVIEHPDTWDWLNSVGRGNVGWEPGDVSICFNRYITAISGNTLTIEAPVFTDLDRSLTQCHVFLYDSDGHIRDVGIEDIRVDVETEGLSAQNHAQHGIEFSRVENAWALRSTTQHASHSGFRFATATRCTIDDCKALQPHSAINHSTGTGGGRNYNFRIERGQLLLFKDCLAVYARHAYVSNGEGRDNGLVFLNCTARDSFFSSEGHRRWSNGFLFDGFLEDSDGGRHLSFQRGGSGHGWNTVHSVMWNCQMLNGGDMVLQRPTSAQNYAIGCFGTVTGNGAWQNGPKGYVEGNNDVGLWPHSLYTAQLAERLNNP